MTVASTQVAAVHQALLLLEATAGLRHDLRNRLASVRNASFYLKRKVEGGAAGLWEADARVPKFFGMIDSELTSAEEIIQSTTPPVLAESRGPSAVDVATLVCDVIATVPASSGVRLIASESGPTRVLADPLELVVGLRCLLDNAIDAGCDSETTIRISCATTDGVARVAIIDDGPGFGEGPRERWLKPFATSKPGRVGLGLNIARRVAARAGGELTLEDGATRGAVVAISLPCVGG